MSTKLHVGNLSNFVTDSDLAKLFARHGTVQSVKIVGQAATGRSFGFVVMQHDVEAKAAVAALEGFGIHGQLITVHEARPREKRLRDWEFGHGRSGGSGGRFGAASNVPEEPH
jgi:RNA recognition motif-containing protein